MIGLGLNISYRLEICIVIFCFFGKIINGKPSANFYVSYISDYMFSGYLGLRPSMNLFRLREQNVAIVLYGLKVRVQ